MKKITKRERFESIIALCEASNVEGFDYNGIKEFCEKEIDSLAHKAAKAKERAAEKRAEGDELTERVFALVGNEPMILDDFVAQFDESEEITKGKVQYRLGQLVKAGRVDKVQVAVEGDGKTRKLMAYCLAGALSDEG